MFERMYLRARQVLHERNELIQFVHILSNTMQSNMVFFANSTAAEAGTAGNESKMRMSFLLQPPQ